MAKTSVTIFPTPLSTVTATGNEATSGQGSLTVEHGVNRALSLSGAVGSAANVGVLVDVDISVPVSSSSITGGVGSLVATIQALESDWQSRVSGSGVVWYHDFGTEAEVDNFRWTSAYGGGNDPLDGDTGDDAGTVVWQTGDGVTGGACLETLRRAGTNDGGNWWRPFGAIDGTGNGRGSNDPAASGTLTVNSYVPTDGGSQIATWGRSWYGHPDYQTSTFDGHDYWIQARVKIHPNRNAEPAGGKLFYFTRTDRSATDQELVTYSKDQASGTLRFNMYRSVSFTITPNQENSEHGSTWVWPTDEWVTVMYHVKGGLSGNASTHLQVWVDWDGTQKVDEFINIWDTTDIPLPYDVVNGHNALICSGYMNGANFSQDIWQRYDQIIFSKDPIPCPLNNTSSLASSANGLSAGSWVSFTAPPTYGQFGISWQNRTGFFDDIHNEFHVCMKAQSGAAGKHYIYSESTDTWRTVESDVHPGSAGHVWTVTFDHENGDYYWLDFAADDFINYYDRTSDAWTQTSTAGFTVQNNSSKPSTGIAYHPNLYGPGDPGVLVWGVTDLAAWRKETDTWESIATFGGGDYWNRRNAPGLYVPGHDKIIIGCGITNTQEALVMDAGSAGSVGSYSLKSLPIRVQGNASESNSAMMLIDPRDRSTIMLLERSSNRVWTSDDMGDTWTLETFTHPFWNNLPVYTSAPDYGSWTCGSIPKYGVVWGMATYAGYESILWRPGS